jgi:hypothetical protein
MVRDPTARRREERAMRFEGRAREAFKFLLFRIRVSQPISVELN